MGKTNTGNEDKPIFKGGYVSILFVMGLFTLCVTVFIGILTWQVSYKASKRVANLLSSDLEIKLLNQTLLGLEERFNSALLATRMNKYKFENGVYDINNGSTAIRSMFFDVTAHADQQYDCMQFYLTTVGNPLYGQTYEAFLEETADGKFWWIYEQTGNALEGWLVDKNNGRKINSAPDDVYQDYSSDTQPWVTVLDLQNPSDEKWTNLYLLFDVAWLSIATVLVDETNSILGVGTVDLSCTFVNSFLEQNAAGIPYDTLIIALNLFNPDGEIQIAGTSNSSYSIYNTDENGLYIKTISEAASEIDCLKVTVDYLTSNYVTVKDAVEQHEFLQFHIKCNLGPQDVTISKPTTEGLDWALVSYTNRDQINQELTSANRTNAGITVAIVIGGTLIALIFSYFLRKMLLNISRDIDLLTEYRFADVLGQDVKGSVLSEFHRVQIALYGLVAKFAQTLKTSKEVTSGIVSGGTKDKTSLQQQSISNNEMQTLIV